MSEAPGSMTTETRAAGRIRLTSVIQTGCRPSSLLPRLIAATSQRGLAPRLAQVSPDGPRYFGGTFLPLNGLRNALCGPAILFNCFSSSARRQKARIEHPRRLVPTTYPIERAVLFHCAT